MTQRFLRHAKLFTLLGCLIIGGGAVHTTAESLDAGETGNPGWHVVVHITGSIKVKREGWKHFAPAMFGTMLRRGDTLLLEEPAHATVVCSDLTMRDVPRGVSGVPCKAASSDLVYKQSRIHPLKGSVSDEFPVIISPRKTKLLNPRPTLRWTPVKGISQYKVSIRGSDNISWTMDAASNTEVIEFSYPSGAPALKPGAAYKVTVTAGNRSSDSEPLPDLGFTVLEPGKVQEVRDREKKIRTLGLADAPTWFLIASLYASQDLNAEAIEQLEGLGELKEPAVMRSLGDLYLKIGLSRLAERRYLRATELSQDANDKEGQALAEAALGRIYHEVFSNRTEAARHLKIAKQLYEGLGDAATAQQLQERLVKLRSP